MYQMRKLLYTLSFILMVSSILMLSYKAVSATNCIEQKKNIIEEQEELEEYMTPYGYTLDNPNIILNPYGISPLTALILFETKTDEEVTIMVKEKDNTIKIQNTFKSNTKHYIPVYGLYPDSNNQVIIECGKITKIYTITTKKLPTDLIPEPVINNTNDYSFLNTNGYLYAIDSKNEVRWYLSEKYKYNIEKLNNGNFIIPTIDLNNDKYPLGIMEINLLGKIYKQYNLEKGYYGAFVEKENNYLIISDDLLEIDKQTGMLIKEIKLKNKYNNISLNKENNILQLQNETELLTIDLKTGEKDYSKPQETIRKKEVLSPIYTIDNYIITKGMLFKNDNKSKESNKNILLIGYKNIDNNYKKYNIKLTQKTDYFELKGNFENQEVYLILDKFLDKRIYDINSNETIISMQTLKGKYSIYLKINNTIYKTNIYIKT